MRRFIVATIDKKRARLTIDVSTEERRQIRLAAAMQDLSIREYVLQAVKEQLEQDLAAREREGLLTLSAKGDPVLAKLWDNEKDAAYDRL